MSTDLRFTEFKHQSKNDDDDKQYYGINDLKDGKPLTQGAPDE
ncbi:unnamed protein product, partial [marine sediment metagenome]